MKEGWEKYNLMDICNVTTGKYDANHAEENGKYRFYTCSLQYVYCNTKRYEGECIILPGNGVNVGESYYFNGEFDAYQRTYVIDKIDKRIIPMFLYYHLQNNWKSEGVAKQYGSATNYIKIGNFKDYIVKSPQSLSEQQAIVDYLDSAFAKIDAMKANAEKALNEAKALFQASLKEMLEPKEGWEEKKLSEVVNILNGYAFPSKAFGDNQELKVVKITNVGVGSFIEDISTLPQKMFIQDVCLKEGDIVIALTRTIISEGLKRAIIPSSYDGAMLNQRVASLRFSGKINMSFLYYYLGCSIVSDYVWLHVNTLMQPNLSIKDLKSMPVCIPSLPEQQSIVETLDSLKSKVDRLQANYDKISQECDALKQAILRQVFE